MMPGLPSIGGTELVIILLIVLLFFGAKRIPDLARSLGRGTREFREGIRGAAGDDKDEVRDREKLDERSSPNGVSRSTTFEVERDAGATRTGQKP